MYYKLVDNESGRLLATTETEDDMLAFVRKIVGKGAYAADMSMVVYKDIRGPMLAKLVGSDLGRKALGIPLANR